MLTVFIYFYLLNYYVVYVSWDCLLCNSGDRIVHFVSIISSRCLSVCPLTLVYSRQTLGRNKMPLGTEISLGPGHIVLDGDPAPP